MSDVLIKVDGVSKKFCRSFRKSLWYGMKDLGREILGKRHGGNGELRPDEFWAVNDVSFELKRGECLGLIGRNGAGKTTLLKMLNGLIKPDKGRIEMQGRIGALIALGAGFNPVLTGRENIYVNASVLGLSKKETDAKLDEIIDFAEIEEFIDSPVQNYSSGMQVRLGFAIATALDPDVLLLDEVLAVGDIAFRTKCFQRIGKLLENCAVIFVSHDAIQVSRVCDYGLFLNKGETVASGITQDVLNRYLENSASVKSEQSITLHPQVRGFRCTPGEIRLDWGETFELEIEIDLTGEIKSGLALLALLDGETTVAQTEFTDIFNSSIHRGHLIKVTLGPIHLKQGDYSLAVTVLSESKKDTVVHALHCASVSVQGPKGYGSFYQLPRA